MVGLGNLLTVQGNVKESRFDKAFFGGFSLVLNGLDNVEARRHVNRLCLSAGVPLIESGTEGYLGQVRPRCSKQALATCCVASIYVHEQGTLDHAPDFQQS